MTDKDFKALQAAIDQKAQELHCLQNLYVKETGAYYTVKLGLKPDRTTDAVCAVLAYYTAKLGLKPDEGAAVELKHKADIDRKNKLLEEALSWLTALEWSVSLGVIVKIEKELGRTEDNS